MMQPKSRKERVAEYGSFLYCPEKDTLCFGMDNDEGICERVRNHSICYLDDSEWLAQQEAIKKRYQENAKRAREERAKEEHSPPAPIRRQTKTGTQLLEEQIEKKEEKARRLYRTNKPKAADSVIREVIALRGRLRKMS